MAAWNKEFLNGSRKRNDYLIHSFETSWLLTWRPEVLESRTGNPVLQCPSFPRAKAQPAKRNERAMGNDRIDVFGSSGWLWIVWMSLDRMNRDIKGGEIRDIKTLSLSRNIVALPVERVVARISAARSTFLATNFSAANCSNMLHKVELISTFCKKKFNLQHRNLMRDKLSAR